MNHAREHEIFPDTLQFPVQTDTILVNHSLDLEKLALQLQLEKDELTRLNPEIRKAMLPETIRNYPLKVPAQKRQILALNRAAILDSARLPVYVRPAAPVMLASLQTLKTLTAPDSTATDTLTITEYTVQQGDFLERIAQKHKVTIPQIKGWNHLKSNTVVPGQKLTLLIPAQPVEPVALAAVESKAEANKTTTITASVNQTRQQARKKLIEQEVKLIHAVQQGDTLWNISKRYNNIPVEKIKKLNKLKSDEIKPGQKLVLS
jgi:membrane-bound lytic murein transglycosylase D